MATNNTMPSDRAILDRGLNPPGGASASAGSPPGSAVSWGAIFAGAAGAAALSLIMLILGTGLGLSSVSPWAQSGVTAETFGISTILWITFTQLVASGMGGYLAGRLRVKWTAVHTDEVYFRDTAHGFLAWAVASLATAALLGTVIGSIVSGGAHAGAEVASGAASAIGTTGAAAAGSMTGGSAASAGGGNGYFVDALFRKDPGAAATAASGAGSTGSETGGATASTPAGPAPVGEVGRIFASALKSGTLPADDARYVGQLVAQRTGLSQADAEKRVNDTFNRLQSSVKQASATAKDAADKARKASAYGALWLFVSLLIGAFCASFAATLGGRQRDY